MKLYLIAGHGAGDPGATAYGFTEAERVRALCSRIKEYGKDKVVYLDPNRDWYADGGILGLNLSQDDCLLECHLDAATPTAKGGHVIIYKEYAPDQYDKNLSEMISGMFPGRAQSIVGRDDLANVIRSAQKNINYRLAEFCFITNSNDINTFNSNIDLLAKRVLACFGISYVQSSTPAPAPKPSVNNNTSTNKIDAARSFDKNLARAYTCTDNLNLRVGAGTNKALIKTMPVGTKVVCHGYYTLVENTKWLCVVDGKDTGYCSIDWLR